MEMGASSCETCTLKTTDERKATGRKQNNTRQVFSHKTYLIRSNPLSPPSLFSRYLPSRWSLFGPCLLCSPSDCACLALVWSPEMPG